MTFKTDIDAEIVDVHLNVDEFGETLIYRPLVGSFFEVKGIFDDAYQGMDTESGAIIDSAQPKVTIRSSDFTAEPVQGDVVERSSGKRYKVAQHVPDGAGIADLLLHEEET